MRTISIWLILVYLVLSFIAKTHHRIDNPVIKFSESPEIKNIFYEWKIHTNIDRKYSFESNFVNFIEIYKKNN